MKICYVLDLVPKNPMGGVKIIFKYANHFAELNHEVTIAVASDFLSSYKRFLPFSIRKKLVQIYLWRGPYWFNLDKRIQRICINAINDSCIPDSDVIFATAVTTAEPVSKLSNRKGEKYYLIQDYEYWAKGNSYVDSTYGMGMHNITIADWLYNKVYSVTSIKPDLIRNPIDTNVFYIVNRPEERKPHTISMICQRDERKGFKYGLKAVLRIKELFPDTSCVIFGISDRGSDIPGWITYKQNVKERELLDIYNSSSIFLCSSISEGFGLCGAESMACGCALVSTDYEGVHSYAVNGENALLSPVRDVECLVRNIEGLFQDNDKRIRIAINGNKSIQKLSWKEAYKKMDSIVLGSEDDE